MRKSIAMLNYLDRSCCTIHGQANAPKRMAFTKESILRLAPEAAGVWAVLSFLRDREIYRSDVVLTTSPACGRVLPPVGRRCETILKGRGFDTAPFPSSAMSLGLGIPWQVALQQSLPPLPQPQRLCKHKEWSVEQFSANSACLTDSV